MTALALAAIGLACSAASTYMAIRFYREVRIWRAYAALMGARNRAVVMLNQQLALVLGRVAHEVCAERRPRA